MMKNAGFLLTLVCLFSHAIAQDNNAKEGRPTSGRLYGRLVDSKTNKGVEAASVRLYIIVKDNAGQPKDSLAGGMLSKPNGDFSVEGLPLNGSFKLNVTAIGFKEINQTVGFVKTSGGNNAERDLGNLKLEQDAETMATVTVTGQKPALQMGIDRKTFDVDKSFNAAGGTAIDVMKNIPSVGVDVDGNVTLRNSTPQIFVDGRPTILTLDQIPADNIERVELVTNPSAKFDAASTGGVINVILKKNKKLGMNGMASVGAGYPGILNGNLTLNVRENKFNYFVSGNYNQSGGIAKSRTLRENRSNGVTTDYFNQYASSDRSRRFGSIRFGVDYFMDNRNTLTLSQNFVNGRNSSVETQDQQYLSASQVKERYGTRISDGSGNDYRSSTQLLYKHKFAEAGKELNADINYNRGSGDNLTSISNAYYNNDGSQYAPTSNVRNEANNKNDQVTIQVDYTDPIGENGKFETGVRSYINNMTSVYNAFSLNNGIPTKLSLSNNYKYREMVNAAYATYTNRIGSIGYQLGLRAEHSKFDGELVDSARKFGYQYPNQIRSLFDALFPSIFLSKQLGDGEEVQVNYTRRIHRPNFWQLSPFVDISDPVNLRQGNPALRPEFTNSFELNYSKSYNSGSFLGVVYYRSTKGEITQYSDTITAEQYQQLNNAAVDPNAIFNTFINASTENRWGSELTLQQKIGKNFDFTPTVNLQYTKVNAKLEKIDLSNEGFNWSSKLIANYRITSKSKLFNKLSFQAVGEYESPRVLPQGRRKENYTLDVAFRKEFLKNNKGVLTFSLNDVFNSNRWGTIYDTENFYQDSYRRRNVRNFRVTFTYKFGKADFSLFKRKGENNNEGGGGEERF